MRRQYLIFAFLLILSGTTAVYAYQRVNREWVYFRLAEQKFESGDFNNASRLYGLAINSGLDDPRALSRLGLCLLRLDRKAEAVPVYERLIAQDPGDLSPVRTLAGLYEGQGRGGDAIALYRRAEKFTDLDTDALIHAGDLNKRMEKFPQAEVYYRRVLELDPGSIPARLKLAETLGWQEKYDQAADLYREVLQKQPDNRQVRMQLARVLEWAGKSNEAARELEQALEE